MCAQSLSLTAAIELHYKHFHYFTTESFLSVCLFNCFCKLGYITVIRVAFIKFIGPAA